MFAGTEIARYGETKHVAQSPSEVVLRMTVVYDRGPIASETYTMQDTNGLSKASYEVADRHDTVARFTEPIEGYGVSFFFDKLVQDGIWQLQTKPPRGDPSPVYTVSIAQTVQNEHGSRTVSFTDPHWWATTAGRQYEIHLDPKKPTPDLVQLHGTSIADPHYQAVVDDFRNFGSDRFKRTIAAARAKLLGAHA